MAKQQQSRSILESVLNCSAADNKGRQISDAYETVTGRRYSRLGLFAHTAAVYAKAIATGGKVTLATMEDLYAISSIKNTTTGNIDCEDPLVSWPIHKSLIDRYGHRPNGGNALMVGAISPFSARAFACLATEEYGAERAHVVDIEGGKDKTRHGVFAYGNALQLPYASGSMDIVQTNQLLHMLKDPKDPDATGHELAADFLSEVSRVLAPGGQLLMREVTFGPPNDMSLHSSLSRLVMLGACIAAPLSNLGFEEYVIEPTQAPVDMRYLIDSTRDFAKYAHVMVPETISVYASKAA